MYIENANLSPKHTEIKFNDQTYQRELSSRAARPIGQIMKIGQHGPLGPLGAPFRGVWGVGRHRRGSADPPGSNLTDYQPKRPDGHPFRQFVYDF